jgi:hypothetical protein
LDRVGFELITAHDINNARTIVGVGYPGRRDLFGGSTYPYTPPGPGETIGHLEDLGVRG